MFEKEIEGGKKIWRYYPFYGIKEIAISFPLVYISNYHTDLANKEANGTAIFNLVKAKNDCESNGAATSAGYGRDDYLSSNPFDVYQTVTAAQPAAQQNAGRRLLQQPAPGGAPAPAGPSYPCSISQAQVSSRASAIPPTDFSPVRVRVRSRVPPPSTHPRRRLSTCSRSTALRSILASSPS